MSIWTDVWLQIRFPDAEPDHSWGDNIEQIGLLKADAFFVILLTQANSKHTVLSNHYVET